MVQSNPRQRRRHPTENTQGKDQARMAISPRMLAVLQKVDAIREAHFAKLRERGKQEADVKARAKAEQAKRKKPPLPKAPRRARKFFAARRRNRSCRRGFRRWHSGCSVRAASRPSGAPALTGGHLDEPRDFTLDHRTHRGRRRR